MHHVADNGLEDCSSTLLYQRDNPWHFAHYFFRFYFLVWYDIPRYFIKHNQPARAVTAFSLEVGSFLMCIYLATAYFWPTFFVFILPYNASRWGMMSGNWVQHAFLEPDNPLGGGLENSITIVDSPFNRAAFNDGYHASHHLNARRHWTEHPQELLRKREKYRSSNAIVLVGTDYDEIFFLLMQGKYDAIAAKWIDVGSSKSGNNNDGVRTKDQVADMLKRKTRQFTRKQVESFALRA